MLEIRNASDADLRDVLRIERIAFGDPEGDIIVDLVENILTDPSAKPHLSLIALQNGLPVGHILFSKAHIQNTQQATSAMMLAPLAVIPDAQSLGVGRHLIEEGLYRLKERGTDIVFVLGHPTYYDKHGFVPAGKLGFEAPYPILEQNAGAWMVQTLRPDLFHNVKGKVSCCDALNKPEYWCE